MVIKPNISDHFNYWRIKILISDSHESRSDRETRFGLVSAGAERPGLVWSVPVRRDQAGTGGV